MSTLSSDQQQAKEAIIQWYLGPSKTPFKLFGLAGTGKTFLSAAITDTLKGEHGAKEVLKAAYTGKAASVLRKAGATGASTVHGLIYRLIEGEQGNPFSEPKFELNRMGSPLCAADLLILDECSMLDGTISEDLLSFEKKILVLGDPGQLPPIEGESFFSKDPDYLLTEIHRQALGSPIIQHALTVREGKEVPLWKEGDPLASRVLPQGKASKEILLKADQVLTGTNKSRMVLNKRIREWKGLSGPYPTVGDKLICLKNNAKRGIYNGEIFTVIEQKEEENLFLTYLLEDDEGHGRKYTIHKVFFDLYTDPKARDHLPKWAWRKAEQFDFGWAITVHKSQGSGWDKVVLYDDGFAKWDEDLRRRWLYTGWTRAAEEIVVYR